MGVGEGGELSCPGPSRAAAVGGALLGLSRGQGCPTRSQLPPASGGLQGALHSSAPHLPPLPAELDRRQTLPPPKAPDGSRVPGLIPGRVASPCSAGSTVRSGWFPVKGKSGSGRAGGGPAGRTGLGRQPLSWQNPAGRGSPDPLPGSGSRHGALCAGHPARSGVLRKGRGCPRPIRAGVPEQWPPQQRRDPARQAPRSCDPGLQAEKPRLGGVTAHMGAGTCARRPDSPPRPPPPAGLDPATAPRTGVISATPLQPGNSVPERDWPGITQDTPQPA